jgi:hypothetical protein
MWCLAIFLLAGVTGCSRNQEKRPESAKSTPAPALSAAPVAPAEPLAASVTTAGFSKWHLTFPTSPSGQGSAVVATVEAEDSIPTRQGLQKPVLAVRCMNHTLDIFVNAFSLGQTVSSDGRLRTVPFRVQFDSLAPRTVSTRESADHESFFLPDAAQEFARLEKTHTLEMSFTQFQGEPVKFSFDTSRFDDARRALKEECKGAQQHP